MHQPRYEDILWVVVGIFSSKNEKTKKTIECYSDPPPERVILSTFGSFPIRSMV